MLLTLRIATLFNPLRVFLPAAGLCVLGGIAWGVPFMLAGRGISVGSALAKLAGRARMYLERVKNDHPGTPWATLAERELQDPLGWKWVEEFTDPTPRNNGNGNANPNPANAARMMLKKGPPKRPPPKL